MAFFDFVDLQINEEDPREAREIKRALQHIIELLHENDRKVTQIMADTSALTDSVSRVADDVAATVTLLQNITSGDPAVQAVIDSAVAKLSAAADALEAADTSATPPVEPTPEPTPEA